jgi:hypothetical protein
LQNPPLIDFVERQFSNPGNPREVQTRSPLPFPVPASEEMFELFRGSQRFSEPRMR